MARISPKALIKKLRGGMDVIQKNFRKSVAKTIGPEITKTIKQGRSPVKGGARRQAGYSATYRRIIKEGKATGTDGRIYRDKRIRPVNLNVSGGMHDSQKVTVTDKGVLIQYTKTVNGENVAAKHNEGDRARNLPARRILPNKQGEEFSAQIQKQIKDTAEAVVKKEIKRINGA